MDEITYDLYRTLRHAGRSHESILQQYSHLLPPRDLEEARGAFEARVRDVRYVSEVRAAYNPGLPGSEWDGSISHDVNWTQVANYLSAEKGHTREALESIEAGADKVVSLLPQPRKPGPLATRGLVLGYVQSGKTTNFISVVAKAADLGYGIFVVLAGVYNSLRDQTQERVDATLVAQLPHLWFTATGDHDFVEPATGPDYFFASEDGRRAIFVVKKNAQRLRRLNRWLAGTSPEVAARSAMLVIDDEADQASLNTGSSDNMTRVHEEIRTLLHFGGSAEPRVAYVGYTATPYANLLVEPLDVAGLYPRDFIVDLPRPSGYVGSEHIFGRQAVGGEDADVEPQVDVIRSVPITNARSLRAPRSAEDLEHWTPSVPSSLSDALCYFLMAAAARRELDGEYRHCSMLIHTSPRVAAQCRLQDPVKDEVERLRRAWSEGRREDFSLYWERERRQVPPSRMQETGVSFEALSRHMIEVFERATVRVDNSAGCSERLTYPDDDPQTVIAVGGNTLSRGLTLEGLVVSYFIRAATAYDTLMQMGRWFGFRPGYAHLQRIWMTDELSSWFANLATVEEEIRRDIQRYEELEKTPEEIAVRIRTHPQMSVTSAAKMRAAVKQPLSFSDSRVQTTRFWADDEEWLRANEATAEEFLRRGRDVTPSSERSGARHLLMDVGYDNVRYLLREFQVHPEDHSAPLHTLLAYLDKEASYLQSRGKQRQWNVVVMGKPDEGHKMHLGLDQPFNSLVRRRLHLPELDHAYIKALMSPGDHRADLQRENPDDEATYRGVDEPGLVILYPIDPQRGEPDADAPRGTRVPLNAAADVLGLGVVIPRTEQDLWATRVEYVSAPLPTEVIDELEEEDDLGDVEPDESAGIETEAQ